MAGKRRNPLIVSFMTVTLFYLMCKISLSASVTLNEDEMRKAIEKYNYEALNLCNRGAKASWGVSTDVGNKEKEAEQEEIAVETAKFERKNWKKLWRDADPEEYRDEEIRRQLYFLKELGESALDDDELKKLNKVVNEMSGIYASATVCQYKQNSNGNCTNKLTLDPDLEERFTNSRNADELKYYWKEWRDNSGKLMREKYKDYVELMNKAAKANDYKNAAAWWQSSFEYNKFVENMDKLWTEVEPLYNDLHTYTKYKLTEIYGSGEVDRSSPNIPAHLLANMWAQTWTHLYDDIKPFKNASLVDVTARLKELKYTPEKMFETADHFYQSLGLPSNKASYTGDSIIRKPDDRVIVCHASAWDFCDGTDFRIKMCTSINQEDFIVIHHEMGHIAYYIQYKDLPLALRGGANPGFHEAIGDTIALSVSTPKHLLKIGLLKDFKDTEEDSINALLNESLERVAFLPYGLLIDKWRWDVFSGAVKESQWNSHYWTLREKYQKISSPVPRRETDFDPGAKYHVAANSQYISYFISHLLEFQLYKALCIEAGEYKPDDPKTKPLHKCDFYESKKAGKKLADGLKLGQSKHWSVALKAITGESELSSSAILEYFKPLQDFLQKENKKLQQDDELRRTLEAANVAALYEENKIALAEWAVSVDVNNEKKHEAFKAATVAHAEFKKDQYYKYWQGLNPSDYSDEKIQRQVMYLSKLGISALDENDLSDLTTAKGNMEKIYNNAVFCPYQNQKCDLKKEAITLDPEITKIMAESTDYDELLYTWEQWHDKSGALMRKDYKTYIDLSNKAARDESNGFEDYGAMWRFGYEVPDYVEHMKSIWKQVQPLYDELHTYTRSQLNKIYGDKMDAKDPLIPAHILGNMWAQSWDNLYDRIKPYKNIADIDITAALISNGYTPLKMFQESDRFYQSLGLESNEMSYTGNSVIEKPEDRVIVCHAESIDFFDGKDFRIKMCTTVNQENFVTIHHEMGHIQYFIQYKDQPITFRTGANPGFHEAIGDTIALSVTSPKHLKRINLLPSEYVESPESTINALLKMALERVAFLPFGLLIDLYRYDLFSGKVKNTKWNKHWEELREEYQKVRSPVPRTEHHFDAGAKFHVPADAEYSIYFFSHILEFQLHRGLCKAAGEYEPKNPKLPLHNCDIEGSKIAGDKLHNGLSLGLSKHWKKALFEVTGETDLRADAILEYFAPLYTFLKKENARNPPSPPSPPPATPSPPSPPVTPTRKPDDEDDSDDGLGSGAIAGIVIGVLCGVGILAYLVYHFTCRQQLLTSSSNI